VDEGGREDGRRGENGVGDGNVVGWSFMINTLHLSDDLSSISGSESDSAHSDDEPDADHVILRGSSKSPFLNFSDEAGSTHSIYRCILPGSQSSMESRHDLERALQALREPQVWIILMRSGGHFAGAVFRG
jgi:hypothetical protein